MKKITSSILILFLFSLVGCFKDTEEPIIDTSLIIVDEDTECDFLERITVKDNSRKDITISHDGDSTVDLTTPGEYYLTVTAKDKAGNEATKEIRVIVMDKTGPVIENSNVTVIKGVYPNLEKILNVTDNSGKDVTVTLDESTAFDFMTTGVYPLTIIATDEVGNQTKEIVNVTVDDRVYNVLTEQTKDIDLSLLGLDLSTKNNASFFTFGNNVIGFSDGQKLYILKNNHVNEYRISNIYDNPNFTFDFTLVGQFDDIVIIKLEKGRLNRYFAFDENGVLIWDYESTDIQKTEENENNIYKTLEENPNEYITNRGLYILEYNSNIDCVGLKVIDKSGEASNLYNFTDGLDKIYIQNDGSLFYTFRESEDYYSDGSVRKVSNTGELQLDYKLNENVKTCEIYNDSQGYIMTYDTNLGDGLVKISEDGTIISEQTYDFLHRDDETGNFIYYDYNNSNGEYDLIIMGENNTKVLKTFDNIIYMNYTEDSKKIYINYSEYNNNETHYYVDIYSLSGELITTFEAERFVIKVSYQSNNLYGYEYNTYIDSKRVSNLIIVNDQQKIVLGPLLSIYETSISDDVMFIRYLDIDRNYYYNIYTANNCIKNVDSFFVTENIDYFVEGDNVAVLDKGDNNDYYINLSTVDNTVVQYGPFDYISYYYIINDTLVIYYSDHLNVNSKRILAAYDFAGNLIKSQQVDNVHDMEIFDNFIIYDIVDIPNDDNDTENWHFTIKRVNSDLSEEWSVPLNIIKNDFHILKNGDIMITSFDRNTKSSILWIFDSSGQIILYEKIEWMSIDPSDDCLAYYFYDDDGNLKRFEIPELQSYYQNRLQRFENY